MKNAKIILFDKEETISYIGAYEDEMSKYGTGEVDFLRDIEKNLDIEILDVEVVDIFGKEYLKIYYYD